MCKIQNYPLFFRVVNVSVALLRYREVGYYESINPTNRARVPREKKRESQEKKGKRQEGKKEKNENRKDDKDTRIRLKFFTLGI